MALKTARTKLRLTEIESLNGSRRGQAQGVGMEVANEAGARSDGGAGRGGGNRSASGGKGGLFADRAPAEEGDAMPYRDSGSIATIGQALTEAREAAGLNLDDVAAQLRIRREFLAALEEGRPDALPGVTYAIGYVRTYAAFLGLDVEKAVTRFKQEAAGLDQRTQLVFPSPAPEGRVPGVGLMFASVLLAGLAYGGWYWMSERGLSVYDMVPEVPERLAALIEGRGTAPSAPAPSTSSRTMSSSQTVQTQPAQTQTPQAPVASDGASSLSGSTAESAYRAANPTSVPVTARSTTGDTAPGPTAAASDQASSTASSTTASSTTTFSTAAGPGLPSAPTGPATDLSATAQTGAEPAADAEKELAAAEDREEVTPAPETMAATDVNESAANQATANQTLAAAAPEPTQAMAATEPLRSPVPSAPRLSGLIGASEAAVPGPGASDQAPASIERVVVRATGESWVQVRAQDGTTLFTRVLRSGDVYRVPDRSGLTLATGNAGALEIVVDGKPAPSLGTFGEVVRNIALDPGRLAAGTAIAGRN